MMSDLQITIPAQLREKLGGGLGPKDILGYKYSSGYWEDDGSWDCPIWDFIEEPVIQVYVANDKNDLLISIEKKYLLQDGYTAFDDLHEWLKQNYGKGNTAKTDGVFGIVKENDKYQIEFGQVASTVKCFHAGMMIESITRLLPAGFEFVGDKDGYRWHWVQHNGKEVKANIFCEIIIGFDESHHCYYHFNIWHETDNASDIGRTQKLELDSVCLNISRMLVTEYPDDMCQHVCVTALYVSFSMMREIGHVEFDVPLNKEETKKLRSCLFRSDAFFPENLRWKDRDLFHKIENKGEAKLAEAFGSQPSALVKLYWGKGERDRLLWGYKSLTEEDIQRMLSYLRSLGNDAPSRKELLGRARGSFVWKEVWTRETGHMWENYTLLKRTPSEEELDYADCSQYTVWLSDLSTETIVKLLKEYKS